MLSPGVVTCVLRWKVGLALWFLVENKCGPLPLPGSWDSWERLRTTGLKSHMNPFRPRSPWNGPAVSWFPPNTSISGGVHLGPSTSTWTGLTRCTSVPFCSSCGFSREGHSLCSLCSYKQFEYELLSLCWSQFASLLTSGSLSLDSHGPITFSWRPPPPPTDPVETRWVCQFSQNISFNIIIIIMIFIVISAFATKVSFFFKVKQAANRVKITFAAVDIEKTSTAGVSCGFNLLLCRCSCCCDSVRAWVLWSQGTPTKKLFSSQYWLELMAGETV